MNRKDHLRWAKDRANELVNSGDNKNALAGFTSDMSKHPDLRDHSCLEMGIVLLFGGHLETKTQMRNWINGFN